MPGCKGRKEGIDREVVAYLPTIEVSGTVDPVVQVIDESSGEIVYNLQIDGTSVRPGVYRQGTYTLKINSQDGWKKVFKGIESVPADSKEKIEINF
jgi:hypothetical protein